MDTLRAICNWFWQARESWGLAGDVIAVVVALGGALTAIYLWVNRKRTKPDDEDATDPPPQEVPNMPPSVPETAHEPVRQPLLPPDLVHPYPLRQDFTGRVRERTMLTDWLTSSSEDVFALIAIGGMGKSAVTWVWMLRDVLGLSVPGLAEDAPEVADRCRVPDDARPEGVLWWSFYEDNTSFAQFVDEAIAYASGGQPDFAHMSSMHDKVRYLLDLLREKRLLLVLDGFERELRIYANLNAAYQGDAVVEDASEDQCGCVDPHASDFLRGICALPLQSRVLMTSRLFPQEMDDLEGCCRKDLTGLSREDAVAYFHARGVKGTRAEIEAACEPYGYLPLALSLLAGVVLGDHRTPGDIKVAAGHPVTAELVGKEEHHILMVAYDELDEGGRELLSRFAAFRSPMDYEALSILNSYEGEEEFDAALDELMERGLLMCEEGRYDLHPIIRQYAYDRLRDREGVHSQLRDYFDAVPEPEEVESIEDLAPVIELYHHTVGAGRYDEARELYRDRLAKRLYFQFGAYQTCIELLRALFPDGEDKPPRLKSESAQGWTLNELAINYNSIGQLRRAMPLFEASNAISEHRSDEVDVAIGLGNLAKDQTKLGELAAATRSLRRRIELSQEVKNEHNRRLSEATGRQELGRLLGYEARSQEAEDELAASTKQAETTGDQQGLCLNESYRALRALLMGEPQAALEAAHDAIRSWRRSAEETYPNECDRVRAEWLLGWAHVAIAEEQEGEEQDNSLVEAEGHLAEALKSCRRINNVEFEPDILIAWARWHRLKGSREEARARAEEALSIADRSEYRLVQADAHNLLARLDLEEGKLDAARDHVAKARERAECDGEPHWYKPAIDEAEELAREIEGA